MKKPILIRSSGPPTLQEIKIYFNQKGMPKADAENFYQFYEKKRWISTKGTPLTKWKGFAYRWIAAAVQDQPTLFDRKIH